MTDDEPRRLSAEEIAALRRAAQNQLVRWRRAGVNADDQDRREHLHRALRKLKAVRDGCAIAPQLSPERRSPVTSGHGTGS